MRTFESFSVGETAGLERVVDAREVDAFAKLTGDLNPLHVDAAYASSKKFGGRVAHGMLLASYVSTLVGMEIPGRSALLLSQSAEFRKPVLLGDRIRLELKVERKVEALRILELSFLAVNQRGETVMTGTARAMALPG